MATVKTRKHDQLTLRDLAEKLGPMPLERIRFEPLPGTAREKDVLEIHLRENRLCELVDGILVEKTVGFREAYLAVVLGNILHSFVKAHKLGIVVGADGMMRLAHGLVRIPDLSFVSWERLPQGIPNNPIPNLAPDLAIEILSTSNTVKEMKRKLKDYFASKVRLVWFVDPERRTVEVFTSPTQSKMLKEGQTLTGGQVLPGFSLALKELFAELDASGN
jgi:Uma2 family endonuclease